MVLMSIILFLAYDCRYMIGQCSERKEKVMETWRRKLHYNVSNKISMRKIKGNCTVDFQGLDDDKDFRWNNFFQSYVVIVNVLLF